MHQLKKENTCKSINYGPWYSRRYVRHIIFGWDTVGGKLYDIVLLLCIISSIIAVAVDSIKSLSTKTHEILYWIEWAFTILFTIEYIIRIWCLDKKRSYILSFYGIVDLISFLPTYLSIFTGSTHFLFVFRFIRMFRVFRIFGLSNLRTEGSYLWKSILTSLPKIGVFMMTVLMIVTILGSIMYIIEGEINPTFSSIPKAIYWATITLTTVGYGDITPITALGQMISTFVMLLGYSIIAVPTGIISGEIAKAKSRSKKDNTVPQSHRFCTNCGNPIHSEDSFCGKCGKAV